MKCFKKHGTNILVYEHTASYHEDPLQVRDFKHNRDIALKFTEFQSTCLVYFGNQYFPNKVF